MYKIKLSFVIVCLFGMFSFAQAKENSDLQGKTRVHLKSQAVDCDATASTVWLDVNNVRAMLQVGGDMWWDIVSTARYIIPNVTPGPGVTEQTSIFAGALWIGGVDPGGALKIAAQTYRQTGNDFWGGPLDQNGSIDQATCRDFDKFWKVDKLDITSHLSNLENAGGTVDISQVPKSVKEWPANGNQFSIPPIPFGQTLAPFYDADEDGFYDPGAGDFPVLDPTTPDAIPDQMIFWVFNDKGNIHTETGADAIGLEVHALAFAYATNDEVNDMTFYKFKVINRNTQSLDSTYFGMWVDPDLGCFDDDYVGCVPELDLGICYNGDATDDGCPHAYGVNPPMVGVDFFKGPIGKDGVTPLKMSSFLYYNNDGTVQGNPRNASDFYNYLSGTWRDGNPFEWGGDGYQENTFNYNFIFPNDPTDPAAGAWSECHANNDPADRRFLQSAGPFTLKPGAVNEVVIGVVWVRPEGDPCSVGFELISKASKKAQALFDNNFKLVDGPDAPNLLITELDRELIIQLVNERGNNIGQTYSEVEPTIKSDVELIGSDDSTYAFQGYKLFQVFDQTVTASELGINIDPDRARLIAQVDVRDDVSRVINYIEEEGRGTVPYIMVEGENKGIRSTFRITDDKFATGEDKVLVNHKRYYFTVVAYAYNNYKAYDPNDPLGTTTTPIPPTPIIGQKQPYLEGRNNVKVYEAIPHIPIMERGGMQMNAEYGDGVEVTRIEGQGNGNFNLVLNDASIEGVIASNFMKNPVYTAHQGPIDVTMVDPKNLYGADFQVRMDDMIILHNDSAANGYTASIGDVITSMDGLKEFKITRIQEESTDQYTNVDTVGGGNQILHANYAFVAMDPVNNLDNGYFTVGESVLLNGTDTMFVKEIYLSEGWTLWDMTNNVQIDANEQPASSENEQIIFNTSKVNEGSNTKYDYPTGISLRFGRGENPGTFKNPADPGDPQLDSTRITGNGFIDALQEEEELEKAWLTWVIDGEGLSYLNWIRAGSNVDADAQGQRNFSDYLGQDDDQVYETVLDGAFAPFKLVNRYEHGPAIDSILQTDLMEFWDLQSIDLVFTSDKSKWTRCVVAETADNRLFAEGGARKLDIRQHGSWSDASAIDGNGLPTYSTTDSGRSWFPGYAINVETGERLNIIFGESSWIKSENGADMIWNPTDVVFSDPGQLRMAGKHHIYVMNSRYDQGANYQSLLQESYTERANGNTARADTLKRNVYQEAMWVGIPMLIEENGMLSLSEGLIPTKTTIQIRVSKPYDILNVDGFNWGRPVYEFSTNDFAVDTNNTEVATSALDLIKVVPNPYYAYTNYENSALDTRIKFTNLPERCTISIYTLNGDLIRRYEKDDITTSLDWDLKNHNLVPIASGMYIIHVNAPDLGEERVLKWFGVMRPTDLDTF